MSPATWTGLTGSALLVSAVALKPLRGHRLEPPVRAIVFLLFFLAAFIPVRDLPLAGYVRGLVGDLSVTTWMLLILAVRSDLTGKKLYRTESHRLLLVLVAISGCLLYPSALGLTYTDVYSAGYVSRLLLIGFLAVALGAWYLEYYLVAVGVTASVLTHSLQIFESRNLWDYWIDPLVTMYALFRVARLAGLRVRSRAGTAGSTE